MTELTTGTKPTDSTTVAAATQHQSSSDPFSNESESNAAVAPSTTTRNVSDSNPTTVTTDTTTTTTTPTPPPAQPQPQPQLQPQEQQQQQPEHGLERDTEQVQAPPADPRVASLKAMFPDYDETILLEVLSSVGGNQDRAIDTLLGMSDPDYHSEPTAPVPDEHTRTMSQTELDEQLARRLLLEEEEEQQAAWRAREEARRQQQQRPPVLQQRPSSGNVHQGGGSGGPAGDTMSEIQQQLGKIAETGKKTFGNIFSKVKAKIQEMDQPKTSNSQPNWGGGGGYDPAAYEHQVYQTQQQPHPQPYQSQNPSASPYNVSSGAPQLPPVQLAPSPSPPITLQGPNVGDAAQHSSTVDATRTAAPPPVSDATRPSVTGSGVGGASAPIDGGKLGLLPKRPVSLLRPDAAQGVQRTQSQSSSHDDGDDLEYAESPFDEPKNAARK